MTYIHVCIYVCVCMYVWCLNKKIDRHEVFYLGLVWPLPSWPTFSLIKSSPCSLGTSPWSCFKFSFSYLPSFLKHRALVNAQLLFTPMYYSGMGQAHLSEACHEHPNQTQCFRRISEPCFSSSVLFAAPAIYHVLNEHHRLLSAHQAGKWSCSSFHWIPSAQQMWFLILMMPANFCRVKQTSHIS